MTGAATGSRWRPVVLLALMAGTACGSATDPGAGDQEPGDGHTYPAGRITLGYLPVDPDRVVSLQPLGNLNVLPEDHGGFYTPREGWLLEPTIPVYAPADGWITSVNRDWYPYFAPYGNDLALEMRVSTTMEITYAHMSDFTPAIWDAAGELEVGYGIWKDVDIEVSAGQVVGYIGTQGALDWHLTDTGRELHFENPSRYPTAWLFAGCYTEYYEEPLRGRLAALSLRSVEPRCGRIDYDVAGRISGNWFLEGEVPDYAFDDYSTHLAIVYDDLEGDRVAIADGIAMRPDSPYEGDERYAGARVFWVEGNGPKPETVGAAEGVVKYEIMDRPPPSTTGYPQGWELHQVGVFLVQMLAPDRIRVDRVMGKRADEVDDFSANARVYIR